MKPTRLLPLALLVLFLFAPLAHAASLLSHIPNDAVALFYWNGSDQTSKAYDNSHLKALLDALNLPAAISQAIQDDLEKKAADPQKQADAKLVQDLLAAAVKAPTALYVGPVDFSDAAHPLPRFALVSQLPQAAALDLANRINASIAKNKKENAPPAAASVVGDYLLLTVGAPMDIDKRLAAPTPADSLADSPAFQKTVAQVGITPNATPAAFLYVNAEAACKIIDDAVAARDDARARDLWPKIQDALHLDQFHQLAWAGNFDAAGNWNSQAFIGLSDPRAGLAALLDHKPLTEAAFKLIPKSVTWAGVARLDLARLFDDLRDSISKADPQRGAQFLDMGLKQFSTLTGVDLEKDLLASLDDTYIYYSTPGPAGNSLKTLTLLTKPKDPAKLDTALSTLETTINAGIAQRNPDSKVQFKTESLPAPDDKITAHVLTLEKASPVWAVANDTFYLAASKAALQAAIDHAAAPKESILDNPQFAALLKNLSAGTPGQVSSFAYIDLPNFAPEFYKLLRQGIANRLVAHPDEKHPYALPPVDKITPTLAPALTITWTDKDGFHAKSTGPFPFAEAINPRTLLFAMFAARRHAAATQPAPTPDNN